MVRTNFFYGSGPIFIFFQACERAESSKCCNLIGSESGRDFTILPANPGGIVGSFIHKFVCCLWMSKNRHFQTIFLLKLALLLALATEKWIFLFRQKIWRENQASQLRKPLKKSKTGGSWCRFTSFVTRLLLLCTVYWHFCSVCSFVFHFLLYEYILSFFIEFCHASFLLIRKSCCQWLHLAFTLK